MVVLSVTNCPDQLRGDITKWLIEIDRCVYVGNLNSRVRENLWERVCDNIRGGKAILIYNKNNEQGFEVLTYNTDWKPIDYDGITLMFKPAVKKDSDKIDLHKGFSKAAKYEMIKNAQKKKSQNTFVILDLETTGLDKEKDDIIEIGMLKISDFMIIDQYQKIISISQKIPNNIVQLTGITDEIIEKEGVEETVVLDEIEEFIGDLPVVGYNVQFDIDYIKKLCEKHNKEVFINKCKDVMTQVRRKKVLSNYRLETVAKVYGIDYTACHRALDDCKILFGIVCELNKK